MAAEDVLRFWFEETRPAQWWTVSDAFDQLCLTRFGELHRAASQGELFGWRTEARGRLAEVLLLDQFSRNLYRGQALAFACDPLALGLAQEAVAAGADQALSPIERTFLYMPYMHSESRLIHVEAERLFRLNGLKDNHDFELRHKAIVDRFGRYPHRNAVLGRESTAEELAFLQQPGSRF
ncbi:DUF924 family protein [Sphaerotilaceae bacterium SBD11-9]